MMAKPKACAACQKDFTAKDSTITISATTVHEACCICKKCGTRLNGDSGIFYQDNILCIDDYLQILLPDPVSQNKTTTEEMVSNFADPFNLNMVSPTSLVGSDDFIGPDSTKSNGFIATTPDLISSPNLTSSPETVNSPDVNSSPFVASSPDLSSPAEVSGPLTPEFTLDVATDSNDYDNASLSISDLDCYTLTNDLKSTIHQAEEPSAVSQDCKTVTQPSPETYFENLTAPDVKPIVPSSYPVSGYPPGWYPMAAPWQVQDQNYILPNQNQSTIHYPPEMMYFGQWMGPPHGPSPFFGHGNPMQPMQYYGMPPSNGQAGQMTWHYEQQQMSPSGSAFVAHKSNEVSPGFAETPKESVKLSRKRQATPLENQIPSDEYSPGDGSSKKRRVNLNLQLKAFLMESFKVSPYPDRNTRYKLAMATNLTQRQIQVWFQNQRIKEKKNGTFGFPELSNRRRS